MTFRGQVEISEPSNHRLGTGTGVLGYSMVLRVVQLGWRTGFDVEAEVEG